MELRLLLIALRILDPRLWRIRVKQLGGFTGAVLWVWFRAVRRAAGLREERDAARRGRRSRIRATYRARQERLLERTEQQIAARVGAGVGDGSVV